MGKAIKYLSPIFIALTLAFVAWAMFTTPDNASVENATAIGANLYWGYALLVMGIVVAVSAACWDLIQKPQGIKGAIFALVAIVAIIVLAYFVASGHTYQIVDLNTQGYFGRFETVITDACIIVAYVAFVAAIGAAIYSAVSDALK